LLAGVVWCGRCGKRMDVRYGRTGRRPASVCSTLRSDYGLPLCQSTTAAEVEQRRRQVTRNWEHRIERARSEADRAGRQSHACEPENRLVARTLERRWDEALRVVQQLESEFDRFTRAQPQPLGEAERERILRLAGEVATLWRAPTTTHADRRQIVRLLIDWIVLNVAPGDDHVTVRVEWAGGLHRERTIRRAVRG
jgi:Recombinase zinc beta ribbon domain